VEDIININLNRHGDGKQVYVSIRTSKGEIVLRADRIVVNVSRDLPNPLNADSPVSIWQPSES